MIDYFDINEINDLVVKGHSYISNIGVKIIDDKNCKAETILEDHFYSFLDLLEVIEERKDVETYDDNLQKLVLRLYSRVNNECIYYDGNYLDLDNPMFSGSVIVQNTKNRLNKTEVDLVEDGAETGDWYLPYLDNYGQTIVDLYPVFVKSRNRNISGFSFVDSYNPPRIYGFTDNQPQNILVILL